MKVLISGGTGLIGRALVDALVSAGHACTVLSRSERPDGLSAGVEVRQWDALSARPLVELLEHNDAVCHLAGESIASGRWTAERKARIRDSRVQSTSAMAEAFAAAGSPPTAYVQASAVGYYGARGDEEVDESSSPADDFLGRTCQEWEAASAPIGALGVRRILLRTGIVLSADGGALPQMALPFKLFAGGKAGSGEQWMPWIHLDDEIAATRFLLEHETADGPFNLTAPQPEKNADFSRVLARVLGRPNLLPAPKFALELALGEMSALILTGQRAVPKRLLELGYEFRYPTLEAALRAIYA